MTKLKKLIVSSLATFVFSASICASAQIESLSVVDNTLYATVADENSRLFVVDDNEGVLSSVFFADSNENGCIELEIGEAAEYKLYLWDKDSLAPVSASYLLKNGLAYAQNSSTAIPEYEFSDYTFNQEDDVMIVSSINEDSITGYKAGVETSYNLTDEITVMGLSDKIEDVVPGSVVLLGTTANGDCSAIELLASIGIPVDPAVFTGSFGFHNASDGSKKYQNFVNEMFSKFNLTMSIFQLDQDGNTLKDEEGSAKTSPYTFESGNVMCYRVGIAMDGQTPVITISSSKISASKFTTPTSVIEGTHTHHNYVYLRYNTETEKLTQCVVYCVPKDFNPGAGDEEYSKIFNLNNYKVILD